MPSAGQWESWLIWGFSLALVGLIFFLYLKRTRRKERANLFRKREAVELGIDRPPVQHPHIDVFRCIGCGSCVAACPEGDVLGMVAGKATILNGLRCVGHGRCAKACPVGAVTVGLGDRAQREDLPMLDEDLQTNRPGIFVAGELGGLALIRHAVEQGRSAARAAIEGLGDSDEANGDVLDLVVVGAGPAGITAGAVASEAGRTCIILEQGRTGGVMLHYPRKSLVLTQPVEIPYYGWLRNEHYTKEALLEIWEKVVSQCGLTIAENERLVSIDGEQGRFEITTSKAKHFAKRVILALGRSGTPRKLGAPGEDHAKVVYRLIDAFSYTHSHLLVVGGGDSAVEAALALSRQDGNTVTLSYRRGRFFRIRKQNLDRLDQAVADNEIQVIFNSRVSDISRSEVVLHTPEGDVTIPNDYVFILIGGIPPFGLLKKTGIKMGGEAMEGSEAKVAV